MISMSSIRSKECKIILNDTLNINMMTIPYYNMINFSFKCYAINFINYLILYVCQYSGTD